MADTNDAQLSYIEETTFGTTPSSALTDLRITSESFGHNITNTQSNEIRSDRQVTDLIQVDAEAAGGYNFELSYGTPPDNLLEGALMTTFGAAASGGAGVNYTGALHGISFSAVDNSINDAASGFITANIRKGQWLRVSGCATAGNNTWHKVESVTVAKIVCTSDTTIVTDDGNGDTVRLVGTVNISMATIAAGNANGIYTFSAGNPLNEGIRVGQWVEIRGFTGNTANNGYKFVTAVDATTFTTLQTTVTDAEGETVTVKGNMIRNGDVLHSYTIQRELEDAGQFFAFRGQVPSELSLSVAAGEIITGSLNFLGGSIETTDLAQVTFGTGANSAAPTSDVMSAVANVAQVMEGSTLSDISDDLFVQSVDFTVNNNLRGRKKVGTLGNASIGKGSCDVTGSFNCLFNDETLYDKFLAGTATGLSFKMEDTSGNAYIVTFPRIKIETDDGGKATGTNADVVENISFRAIRHSTYNCTIQIDKFPA